MCANEMKAVGKVMMQVLEKVKVDEFKYLGSSMQIPCKYIRTTAQVKRFGNKVIKTKLTLFGHERRYIGQRLRMKRPQRRFMDAVMEEMQKTGVTEVDARDRVSWRQMISCGDTQYQQVEEEEDFPMLNLP